MKRAMGKKAMLVRAAVFSFLMAWGFRGIPCNAQQGGIEGGRSGQNERLILSPQRAPEAGGEILRGTYRVYEDREACSGRMIDLNIVVLRALRPDSHPDPVFFLDGGPGAGATRLAGSLAKSWMRQRRDIVLVDQRGTGRSNPLQVPLSGSDGNLQGYLDPIFQPEIFRPALERLKKVADLTLYTTLIAMDDLNEVRAALVYVRRHAETVRSAVLNGVAPPAFINPLYHAREAQAALERIFEECEGDPVYRSAFPDLRGKFPAVLERLKEKPARVSIAHPVTGERTAVLLTKAAFAEALRVMMYFLHSNRQVPHLIARASDGDYEPFAQQAVLSNRAIRNLICFGMLMCVVGSEDIPRIEAASIPREIKGTFLGDDRIRKQMAIAEFWPRGRIPPDYGEPVRSNVPVLLLSGTHDPVTPPRWGEEAAKHLPNSLHLVAPGAHGVGGPEIDRVIQDFLERGSVSGLDTSGVREMRLPRFALPGEVPTGTDRKKGNG